MSVTLEIDAISVPRETFLAFEQEYEQLSAADWRRTADGSGILRVAWTGKLRTVITGNGWACSLFSGLAEGATHTLKCAAARSVDAVGTSITLPVNRRSDSGHEPIGYAHVAGRLVETSITDITSNVATLDAVDGATGYRVEYLPELVVHIMRNTSKYASRSNDYAFEIEAVEA